MIMRYILTIMTMAALCGGLVFRGVAEDAKATKSPDNKLADGAKTTGNIELRAEIPRTLAALIEARSVEKPDQGKVDELTQMLQQLRGKLRAQNVAATGSAATGWGCPWGGPGLGYGRSACWGGGGRGPRGGFGHGGGHGWGGGAGHGRGFGTGAGQGLAPGGAAFVDKDGDGVCDQFELRQGMHR
jgi:hypothetical protein